MRKLMIFLSASLTVSAMVMYMYNTAASALTGGEASGKEGLPEGDSKKSAPKAVKSDQDKRGTMQQSAVQRNQDPDMHSAAKAEVPSSTNEEKTGNVD